MSDAESTIDYWAPMLVFAAFTAVEPLVRPGLYPFIYSLKAAAVTGALFKWRRGLADVRPEAKFILPAVLVGVLILVEWIVLDKAIPYAHLGRRIGFNPFETLPTTSAQMLIIAVRLYGLVILVPVMEEIFWRSFLLRYMTVHNFQTLPIGEYSREAFWVVALAFGIAHTEWLVAIVAGCLLALLLRRTGSLFAAIVAHAVANAGLGLYILVTHEWLYW